MPTIVDKIKLPQQHDRRVKLLDDDKELIKELYATGQYSLNQLARQFNVSKKTILLIVNTNSKKKNDDYIKAHWKEYQQDKDDHRLAIKKTREHKRELLKQGKI